MENKNKNFIAALFKKQIIAFADLTGSMFIRYLPEKQKDKYILLLKSAYLNCVPGKSVKTILGFKIITSSAMLIPALFLFSNPFIAPLLVISLSLAGFFLPDFILKKIARIKTEELNKELPYIIDLLHVSLLSGQNIYNSIRILVDNYKSPLCAELSRFLSEIDFGIGKNEAYNNVANRQSTENFKKLLFLMLQAEKYGASISGILKQKSRYLRFESMQRCEMHSRKVSITLLFPLIFLILPAFILLVGGPLIFSVAGSY